MDTNPSTNSHVGPNTPSTNNHYNPSTHNQSDNSLSDISMKEESFEEMLQNVEENQLLEDSGGQEESKLTMRGRHKGKKGQKLVTNVKVTINFRRDRPQKRKEKFLKTWRKLNDPGKSLQEISDKFQDKTCRKPSNKSEEPKLVEYFWKFPTMQY